MWRNTDITKTLNIVPEKIAFVPLKLFNYESSSLSMKCPIIEMSYQWNFLSMILLSMKCSSMKFVSIKWPNTREVPEKNRAWSVQPFWRLLVTNKQTNRQLKSIYRLDVFKFNIQIYFKSLAIVWMGGFNRTCKQFIYSLKHNFQH